MDLSSSRIDGWTVATVTGEIDVATAPRLRGYLSDLLGDHGKPTHIIVDLSRVTFCDASGVGTFVGINRKAQWRASMVRIVIPMGRVRWVFRITGGTHDLSVYKTLSDAIAAGA
ncbi:STAS domain-containing protein [Streptomyces sp. NPDC056309]|uniref:STAS domain-containing protein n=1 Tax=unclassified Streptomyces TaxID=2593676 RepID=UPI0035DD41E5